MFGIPFTLRRFGDHGVEDEVLYLRTHRRGEVGLKMRALLRRYHQAAMTQTTAAARVTLAVGRAVSMMGSADVPTLEGIEQAQNEALESARGAALDAQQAAEEIAELALRENYGDGTDAIMDKLTDHDLNGIVSTIELGSMPKDFFPSPDTPPKPSATGPSGDSPAKPS